MTTVRIERVSWLRFYILHPLCCLGRKIRKQYRAMTKRWYCTGCGKYHSGRIILYSQDGENDYCHRHMTNRQIATCEYIGVGDQNITSQIKRAVERQEAALWGPLRISLQGKAHPRQIPFELQASPYDDQAVKAAGVVREYCCNRIQVEGNDCCVKCKVRFACQDPPYAWLEPEKPTDGGTVDAKGKEAQQKN